MREQRLQVRPALTVGASLLAMGVNDNACFLNVRATLKAIASKLAPTKEGSLTRWPPRYVFHAEFFRHRLTGLLHFLPSKTRDPAHASVATRPMPSLRIVHFVQANDERPGVAMKGVFNDEKFCVVHKTRIPPCGIKRIIWGAENSVGFSDGCGQWRQGERLVTMHFLKTPMIAAHGPRRTPRPE